MENFSVYQPSPMNSSEVERTKKSKVEKIEKEPVVDKKPEAVPQNRFYKNEGKPIFKITKVDRVTKKEIKLTTKTRRMITK